MKTYLFTYFCSAFLALVITPVVIRLARKLKMLDGVHVRKVHLTPIPRIGGAAVFASTMVLVIVVLLLDNRIGEIFRGLQVQVVTLLAAGTFIFLVGLVDDLHGVRARYKLLAQIIAASAVCLAGVRIETINVANLFTMKFGWLAFPISIFWIISITNAVNLTDGLDGLAAGISAITCAMIAVFAFNNGQLLMVVFMLSLLGSLSGFLVFNFNPARIFMGDCGSMFLGFVLASTSVMCAVKSGTLVALALPAIALGLPIFDMAFSILRRYLGRWGIMSPDRGHLHHRLLDMGLRHRHAVIVLYTITLLATGLGMFMMIARGGGVIIILICVLVLLVLVFRALGAVRLRETIAQLRYRKSLSREIERDVNVFHDTHLRFHNAASFRQWWRTVVDTAEKVGFSELFLTTPGRNGRSHRFAWRATSNDEGASETVNMRLSIGEERFGVAMEIEAKIIVNGSLESAGRRMMLFGRLIDAYGIAGTVNPIGSISILGPANTKQPVKGGLTREAVGL